MDKRRGRGTRDMSWSVSERRRERAIEGGGVEGEEVEIEGKLR